MNRTHIYNSIKMPLVIPHDQPACRPSPYGSDLLQLLVQLPVLHELLQGPLDISKICIQVYTEVEFMPVISNAKDQAAVDTSGIPEPYCCILQIQNRLLYPHGTTDSIQHQVLIRDINRHVFNVSIYEHTVQGFQFSGFIIKMERDPAGRAAPYYICHLSYISVLPEKYKNGLPYLANVHVPALHIYLETFFIMALRQPDLSMQHKPGMREFQVFQVNGQVPWPV